MASTKGFSGIRPGATRDFIPEMFQKDPEPRPTFVLTILTITQKQSIYDRFYDNARIMQGMTGECYEAVILPNVKGMKNCPEKFAAIDEKLDPVIYEQFDFKLRAELFYEIMSAGRVTKGETDGVKS